MNSKKSNGDKQKRSGPGLTKKTVIIVGAVIIVIIAVVLISHFTSSNRPEYRTVLPDNKSIDELGGWKRVSPPEKDPVYAYADKINDIPISVSQQPLPASFKTETASHVADLAKAYNATTKISVGDTTVYIGTSSKGPQSVIFADKNLLVLIKSEKAVDNASWGEYIKSLGSSDSGRIPKY